MYCARAHTKQASTKEPTQYKLKEVLGRLLELARLGVRVCVRVRIRTRTHTHTRALHLKSIALYFIRIFFPSTPMHELSATSLSSR